MELRAIADQWRKAWNERARADALGELFREAMLRLHGGARPATPVDGASRALLLAGMACDDDGARGHALSSALDAALLERRSTWTLETLATLAMFHPPALSAALAAARDRPAPKSPAPALLARACVETLAKLVAAAPTTMRRGLFVEMLEAADAVEYEAFNMPYLLAHASPGIGPLAPEDLLARVASGHPYYRALAHSLVAKDLPPEARRAAVAAALSDPHDPSLGDARPFVALAPWLEAEHYPRALDLARRLHSSIGFGATAMRVLLPGWAALGNVQDAAVQARALGVAFERAVALGNIATHAHDEHARDELVLEALALLDEHDDGAAGIALLAERLVPLGYGSLLLDSKHGKGPGPLLAVARYSIGKERVLRIEELAHRLDVRYLEPFARELDPKLVFPRWWTAFAAACEAGSAETFFEDESGGGLVEWMAAIPVLGGADGLRQVADAIVP